MPLAVPETSVLRSHTPSQASSNRSAAEADAAAHPFSALLDSAAPAQDAAPPDRGDSAGRRRPEPARDDNHAAADAQRPHAAVKATKSKQSRNVQDGKKDEGAKPASGAKDVSKDATKDATGVASDTKLSDTEAAADAGTEGDPATGTGDPSVLLADATATPAADAAVNSALTVPVPVPAAPAAPATPVPSAAGEEIAQAAATIAADASAAAPVVPVVPVAAAKPETQPVAQAAVVTFAQAVADPKPGETPANSAGKAPVLDPALTKARGEPAASKDAEADGKTAKDQVQAEVTDIAASSPHSPRPEPRAELQIPAGDANSAAPAGGDAATNVSPLPAPPMPGVAGAVATAPPSISNTVAVPIAGLAVEIAARAQTGKNHFEIRLDPPELGRINVRLDVDRDGHVTSHVVVDRVETLDLLRRDAPNLDRAFQQAGLKTSDNGMQFSLRDQGFSGRDNGGQTTPGMARLIVPDDQLTAIDSTQRNYGRLAGFGGGVDIRV